MVFDSHGIGKVLFFVTKFHLLKSFFLGIRISVAVILAGSSSSLSDLHDINLDTLINNL